MLKMGLAMGLEEHLKVRQSRPDINILDIAYDEVTGPSDDIATKIYNFCGMPLRNEALQNIRNWEAANLINKLGAFTYNQVDYQLTPELIDKDFGPYMKFASHLF
jgi:hypothetical protein